jgi:hypothetical protein
MASWDPLPYQLIAVKIESSAKVVSKDHWAWTMLWVLGLIFTLGILAAIVPLSSWRRRAATVATLQGHPETPIERTVAHEAGHNWQYQWMGWLFFPITWINRSFRAWMGAIPFLLTYFVIPFPVFLCYGRYRLELSADRKSWEWMLKSGQYTKTDVMFRAKEFSNIVAGKQYGWCWPGFWVRWGFKRAAKKLFKQVGLI